MTTRRTIDVPPMRPGRRIGIRIELSRALRTWADGDPVTDPVDHAQAVSTVVTLLGVAQRIAAEDRARSAAGMWASGVRQVDIADAFGVSRTRLTQLLDTAQDMAQV